MSSLSRRNFLKLAGAATLAVLPAAPALAQTIRSPVMRALAPASAAGEAWLAGLQTGARFAGRWEVARVSALPSRLEETARAWTGGVWAALMQPGAADGLAALAQRAGASLWLSTTGAHPAPTGPQIVSGRAWETAYAAGVWTVKRLGRRVAQAASLHDAGYHLLAAFEAGVQAAGGAVVTTVITHNPAQPDFTPAEALSRLAEHKAEAIHLSAFGRAGQELAAGLAGLGLPVIANAWGSVPASAWLYGTANPFGDLGQRTAQAIAAQWNLGGRFTLAAEPGVWHNASRAPAETLTLPDARLADTLFPAPRSGWITEYGHLA